MLTSKLVLATSLALAVTGAIADSGDLNINDWSNGGSAVSHEQFMQGESNVGERGYVFAQDSSPERSRAEVVAELREAQKLGLISVGESDAPIATAEQEALIAKAGHDAEQYAKSGDVEG
jgi:hypothetical protein